MRTIRVALAASLALTGYLHADLYSRGYRGIPVIGPSFLLLASVSFALAVLFLVAVALPEPLALRLLAAGVAGGAITGFALSRTVGLFGFVERGLQPAPQALLSLIAETIVLLLTIGTVVAKQRRKPASA